MNEPLATTYDSAERSPGLLLWRVTNRWQASIRAALQPHGLTHVQFVLLASLTWLGGQGPVTQKALADHAATDPMMTSQVLRALEQRRLVCRAVHPSDGRAKSLSATPAGVALANATVGVVEACDRAFFEALGAEEPAFVRALTRLATAGRGSTSRRHAEGGA